jgi:hypothetical protein
MAANLLSYPTRPLRGPWVSEQPVIRLEGKKLWSN